MTTSALPPEKLGFWAVKISSQHPLGQALTRQRPCLWQRPPEAIPPSFPYPTPGQPPHASGCRPQWPCPLSSILEPAAQCSVCGFQSPSRALAPCGDLTGPHQITRFLLASQPHPGHQHWQLPLPPQSLPAPPSSFPPGAWGSGPTPAQPHLAATFHGPSVAKPLQPLGRVLLSPLGPGWCLFLRHPSPERL